MQTQEFSQHQWIKEQNYLSINLPRWQQQTELLNAIHHATACFIVQFVNNQAQVVCGESQVNPQLIQLGTFSDEKLYQNLNSHFNLGLIELSNADLGEHFNGFTKVLGLQLFWPEGQLFGCILLCDPMQTPAENTLTAIIDTVKSLLQAELKHLYYHNKIQGLSVQDDLTSMLNFDGFTMMAPRLLGLSRRFGSHAGIIILEGVDRTQHHSPTKDNALALQKISRIITTSMREADIAARYSDNQFILLVFIDHKTNLDSIIARLNKQFDKKHPELKINIGKSYFSPDARATLIPMINSAISDLENHKSTSAATIS